MLYHQKHEAGKGDGIMFTLQAEVKNANPCEVWTVGDMTFIRTRGCCWFIVRGSEIIELSLIESASMEDRRPRHEQATKKESV